MNPEGFALLLLSMILENYIEQFMVVWTWLQTQILMHKYINKTLKPV